MRNWLDPLCRALDTVVTPVAFFFRNDDVGWGDDRLFALLDLFARYGLPLDLAVIPQELTSRLAYELTHCLEDIPAKIGVHQHGFAHVNHESAGRKSEFGPERAAVAQRQDIARGLSRLVDLLGTFVESIFTPPWNRCTVETGYCLEELNFHILSRDLHAPPRGIPGLVELPVTIDWFAHRKGDRLSHAEVVALIASRVQLETPVGIMFHHTLMDTDERRAAGELLAMLARHDLAQCYSMMELVREKWRQPVPLLQ
jgi:hypothetical protein